MRVTYPHEFEVRDGLWWCTTENVNSNECEDENRCSYTCVCNKERATCSQCGKDITQDSLGDWVDDDTGGDVCGVLGGNEPHVPGSMLLNEEDDIVAFNQNVREGYGD